MLGEKIRNLRKSQNLKLSDVAERSNLSVSYISQLERDLVEPSLSSLKKIAGVLNTPIYMLVDDSDNENIVLKKEDRPSMTFKNSDTRFEIVSTISSKLDFSPKMMMVEFFIPPNGEDSEEYITHLEEEIILVTSGTLEINYGNEKYILNSGDSIYVRENIPHRIINNSNEYAEGYYVVTPPTIPKE